MNNDYTKRELYIYRCKRCGKSKRQTVDQEKAKQGLCRVCLKVTKVDKNQMKLL